MRSTCRSPTPEESLRQDVARLRDLKTLPESVTVAGLVYDVRTGELREVVPA
jgi:carbonic anhydrase